MSGQVVAFRDPKAPDEREALIAAIGPLHTLITLDPILGASPVRIYFVLNPQARARIAESLDPNDRSQARFAQAFALVAYDFPFALQLSREPHRRYRATAPRRSSPAAPVCKAMRCRPPPPPSASTRGRSPPSTPGR